MGNLKSDLFQGPGNAELEACAVRDSAHILRGGRSGPHVGLIQTALRRLNLIITDPPNVYGASTERAVLDFKGPPRNILGPGQRTPDGIVGKKTIAVLDQEMVAFEANQPPPTPIPTFGSTSWRFSFSGNKGFTGKGVYHLFIGSREAQFESSNFDIDERFVQGSLKAGFKGDTEGFFQTPKKVLVKVFDEAICNLNLVKLPFSDRMQGTLRLDVTHDEKLTVFLNLQNLKDETLGTTFTTGDFIMNGILKNNRPRASASQFAFARARR